MKELQLLSKIFDSAVRLTQSSLICAQEGNFDKVEYYIYERGKALEIINHMIERLSLNPTYKKNESITHYNNQVNQLVELIKISDEKLIKYLKEESIKTQNQIAKTFKNKENLRGYNLNKLK